MQKRHKKIIERVQALGYVSIEDLSQEFAVTPQTIRKDVNLLSEEGVLRRYHGGAGSKSTENIGYSARQTLCLDEKRVIAAKIAQRIPSKSSLFINIGTTTEEVAKALVKKDGLRVITNNLNVAIILNQNPAMEIYMAGGEVRHRDCGITGHATLDFITQFRTDFCVIGIAGISENGDLLDFDYQEVQVAKAIIANSAKTILAADHSKFGRQAMVRMGHVSDIDELFTDTMPSPSMQGILNENGVTLHV